MFINQNLWKLAQHNTLCCISVPRNGRADVSISRRQATYKYLPAAHANDPTIRKHLAALRECPTAEDPMKDPTRVLITTGGMCVR